MGCELMFLDRLDIRHLRLQRLQGLRDLHVRQGQQSADAGL